MSDPIDYEALARRALDVPPSADDHAALRVWADQLEAAGDPRGTLIALEHAARVAPARRHELRKAALDHADRAGLLGPIAALARTPRAVELDWRAGQLYGLELDLQRIGAALFADAGGLVARVLDAPVCAELRRLSVRTRGALPFTQVIQHGLCDGAAPPPLEEIAVFDGGAPRPYLSDRDPPTSLPRLLERYPALRRFAAGATYPLPCRQLPDAEVARLTQIAGVAAPETPAGRAALGRALLRLEPALRDAALARVTHLGPRAAALLDTLVFLLRGDNTAPKLPIALALAQLGTVARPAIPALAAITGRPAHSAETRRAAGVALAALRQTS